MNLSHPLSVTTRQDMTITQYNRQMNIARTIAQRNFGFAADVWQSKGEASRTPTLLLHTLGAPKYQLFLRAAMSDLGLLHDN